MSALSEQVSVVKMHGTHNEFIVLDDRSSRVGDYSALARRLCDRREGLGADGLLVITAPPPGGDALATMRVINADGGEAEMCGNGARCVARYLAERGAGDRFTLATLAGPIALEIVAREPEWLVKVDVGVPYLVIGPRAQRVEAAGEVWHVHEVRLGNPHAVIFVGDLDAVDLERVGAALSTNPKFPDGINVHFVQVIDKTAMRVRHYERGVGITQACGTGAVASAAVAILMGSVHSPVEVRVPGGTLTVAWLPTGSATLTGPAEIVFERTLAL